MKTPMATMRRLRSNRGHGEGIGEASGPDLATWRGRASGLRRRRSAIRARAPVSDRPPDSQSEIPESQRAPGPRQVRPHALAGRPPEGSDAPAARRGRPRLRGDGLGRCHGRGHRQPSGHEPSHVLRALRRSEGVPARPPPEGVEGLVPRRREFGERAIVTARQAHDGRHRVPRRHRHVPAHGARDVPRRALGGPRVRGRARADDGALREARPRRRAQTASITAGAASFRPTARSSSASSRSSRAWKRSRCATSCRARSRRPSKRRRC